MVDTVDTAKVPRVAFAFCRYTVMLIVWLGLLFKIKALIVAAFAVLALSAALGIRRAPLVALWTYTIHRRWPSVEQELSVSGMRFAHILGAALGLACLVFLYGFNERVGWGLTLLFAVMKTVSALGLCPAYKLHGCVLSGGTCCSFLRRKS
jgi:hypothetical protein